MDITAREILQQMRNVDVRTVDINSLKDIREVKIDPNLSDEERMIEYLKQIENPYCYRHGIYAVKISYAEDGYTLNECLDNYLKSMV